MAAAQLAVVAEVPSETRRMNSPELVSQDDCASTSLELTVTGAGEGQVVSVWVTETTDCSVAEQRAAGGGCFDTGISFNGSSEVNTTATLAYHDLLEAFGDVTDCRDDSGVADGRSLRVYLLVDVDANDTTDFATLSTITGFDLVGPPPISIAAAAPQEDALVLSFEGTPDPGALSYQIFAEPAEGGACTAPNLTAGEVPPAALAVAQRSGAQVDDLEVGLEADVRFAVGVAAVDNLGNRGPLSPLACATPLSFAALDSTGGCHFGGHRDEAPSGWWLAPLALLALRRGRRLS